MRSISTMTIWRTSKGGIVKTWGNRKEGLGVVDSLFLSGVSASAKAGFDQRLNLFPNISRAKLQHRSEASATRDASSRKSSNESKVCPFRSVSFPRVSTVETDSEQQKRDNRARMTHNQFIIAGPSSPRPSYFLSHPFSASLSWYFWA